MSVNQQNMKCSSRSMSSRKYLVFSILFVMLTFPHSSDEFSMPFGVGGGGGDGKGKDVASKLMSKFKIENKFKFHKIERLNLDDDVNVSGDNDGGEEDDDEVDDDVASKQQQNENSAAADSSRANEDEEIQFERAHKVHKETRKKKETKQKNEKVSSNNKEEQSESLFSSLFGGWFGGGSGVAKKTKHTSSERDKSEESIEKSNGIIDWLKWIGEKTRIKSPPPVEPEPVAENWLSYLNRWPFNTLFPVVKPPKPIPMPRRGRSANTNSNGGNDDGNDDASYEMSQEHFESLLHTLPGFVANSSHISNTECRQQLQIFYRQLRGNKLWTLQMLDATGKITSGLLRGNINQFGDFDLCTQVKTKVKVTSEKPVRIRGKYCLAHIEMQTSVKELKVPLHLVHGRGLWNSHLGNPSHFAPRYAVANWGICIPNMCSGEVVQQMIETNLRPYNTTGVEFHVEVDDDDCYMRERKKFIKLLKKDGKFAITIFYISSLILLTVITLIYEHWTIIKEFIQNKFKKSDSTNNEAETKSTEPNTTATEEETVVIEEKNQEETPATTEEEGENMEASAIPSLKAVLQEIFKSFSPKRSLSELLSQDRPDVEFPVFHALKLFATFMLYICLKYLMIGHLPISNRDKLVRAIDNPLSVIFRAPMIYTDILLLISGFLSAYQLSEEMERKTYIQLLKRMASKIARCLPTVYVVLFFQTFILPHLGSGPLWSNLIGQNAHLCEQQMWRNVFSVQNAIEFEETCSPMTIQLALDVQLYLLGPLIVWLYYTDADAAFFAYGAIHAMSVAARYSRTQREHLSMTLFHGMNVSKFYRTANILYSSPISRATPYLLGIGAGLFQRSQMGTFEVSPELVPVGWAIAGLSVLWCFWSPSAGMRSDYIYSSGDAASYASWSPLILGLALIWIIFMFPKSSENSVLKIFTSSRPILFMSRISFPMQLVMYVVVVYNTASVKETRKYHLTDLINFNEIATILLFAVLLAFLIDIPSQNIRRLLVNSIFKERLHSAETEQEPVSGAEQSEAEDHSDHERVSNDTPDPGDGVWASDPEEEEHKYLERRRSSTTIVKEEKEEETEESTSETTEKEQDDEEETEIDEEAEIKKRPDTPPPPAPTPAPKEEDEKPTYRRRRRPTSDD